MDAHLFSRFCEELAPRIIGGWLEKVQEPAPGLLAFNINLAARGQSYGQAGGSRKCQLCLRAARKEPFLFLSRSRLAAGRAPSAPVMRLRKYLAGHRILAGLLLQPPPALAAGGRGGRGRRGPAPPDGALEPGGRRGGRPFP